MYWLFELIRLKTKQLKFEQWSSTFEVCGVDGHLRLTVS